MTHNKEDALRIAELNPIFMTLNGGGEAARFPVPVLCDHRIRNVLQGRISSDPAKCHEIR